MTSYVAYCRVSTDKQGRRRLGLEAQQAAIQAFLKPGDALLQPPYIEVESGKRSDRPQLRAAVDRCRRTGAILLIVMLDRLARNLAFVANLMESGVEFVAADNPLTIHILAAVAEDEPRPISDRTKAALAAARARGKQLGGGPRLSPLVPSRAAVAAAVRQLKADHAAFSIPPSIERLRAAGVISLNAIAAWATPHARRFLEGYCRSAGFGRTVDR